MSLAKKKSRRGEQHPDAQRGGNIHRRTLGWPIQINGTFWNILKSRIIIVYKALVGKLPNYLMSLLKLKSICHNTRSQSLISLEIPLTKTNIGKIAFKFFASHKWNTIQVEL